MAAKCKVVTSGRLTGAARGQSRGQRAAAHPGSSSDSEDQVSSLHEGLDRCAALLSAILQADEAASPSPHRTGTSGAAKSRPSTSVGKKTLKRVPPKTDPRSRPGGAAAPAAHSGVKLHPPQKRRPARLQARLLPPHGQTLRHVSRAGEERVPVRDTNTAVTQALRDATETSPGQGGNAAEDTGSREESSAEAGAKARTVQYLLAELKALVAGQGSVAERLLSHLEQTVSSPLMNVGHPDIQAESVADLSSLHRQNTHLHRRVRILNQQLKEREKAERRQNQELLCGSEVLRLQEELGAAQSRLHELQDDLTDLRKALQDTQTQLRDREAENALMKTDLEATKSRLLTSEREKSELASVVRRRLAELGGLSSLRSTGGPAAGSSASRRPHRLDPPAPPSDRVAQYLRSLGQMEPVHAEHVQCVAAEREGSPVEPGGTPSRADLEPAGSPARQPNADVERSGGLGGRRQLFDSTRPPRDAESVCSDWSAKSGSTFDTRDEAAFRDGLAALDASIASLQKSFELDLRG